MIVVLGLYLGLDCTDIRTLQCSTITTEIDHEGMKCLRYTGIIGSYDSSCKKEKGGLPAAKKLPITTLIFDENRGYGTNLYQMMMEHCSLCELTGNVKDTLFSPNHNVSAKARFLKSTPIGKNSFSRHWQDIVTATGTHGVGPHPKSVLHSLR